MSFFIKNKSRGCPGTYSLYMTALRTLKSELIFIPTCLEAARDFLPRPGILRRNTEICGIRRSEAPLLQMPPLPPLYRIRLSRCPHLERFNPAVMALEGIVNSPRFIESHRLSTFKPRGLDVSVVHSWKGLILP